MANDYFEHTTTLTRHTLARASVVNTIFQAVETGFAKLPGELPLKQGRVGYVVDTGAANAYVVAPTHAPTSYVAGLRITMKAANANTGAATINVSSLGVKSIKRFSGVDLSANDILAGAIIELIYDGSVFQILGTSGGDAVDASDLVLSDDQVAVKKQGESIGGLTIPAQGILARLAGTLVSLTAGAQSVLIRGAGSLGFTTIAAGRLVGRPSGGNLGEVTPAQGRAILSVYSQAEVDARDALLKAEFLHVQDQKLTDGGTFSWGAWRTRDLNTVLTNTITGASLASNQITLPAGTYYIEHSSEARSVNNHQARLRDTTGSATLLSGTSSNSDSAGSSQGTSNVTGRFTLSVESVLEIQHQCQTSHTNTGLGSRSQFTVDHETYTDVRIWRVA